MSVRFMIFDASKAIEATLWLASSLRDPTFHKLSKLLYFSDKLHLQRYGRMIFGDDYVAMKHGPVPSRIYDMMKAPTGRAESPWGDEARNAFDVVNGYTIKPLRAPNTDVLSQSEMECLTQVCGELGKKSFRDLTSVSHDAAWKAADENESISLEDIAKTLPNAEEILEHLEA